MSGWLYMYIVVLFSAGNTVIVYGAVSQFNKSYYRGYHTMVISLGKLVDLTSNSLSR